MDKEFFVQALEHCGDHLCIINRDGEIIYVNQSWIEFGLDNGAKQNQWLGLNYVEVCSNAVGEGSQYANVLKEGLDNILYQESTEFMMEYPCHSQDIKRWFKVKAIPFFYKKSKFVAMYHRPVKSKTEMELNQERLNLAADTSGLGIWDLDFKENKLIWNRWMYVIYGQDPQAFTPTYENWSKCVHPDDKVKADREAKQSITERTSFNSKFRVVRPSGEVRYVVAKAQLISDGPSASRMIGVNVDITDRVNREYEIEKLQHYDQLTGLPNRERLIIELNKTLSSTKTNLRYFAFVIIGIDNFKRINDSIGYNNGDSILLELKERLLKYIGRHSYLSRIGGDEFAVIFKALDKKETKASNQMITLCRKIEECISEPYNINKRNYKCTASLGVTLCNDFNVNASKLLREANMALHRAKENEHDSIRFYHHSMDKQLSKILEIEHDLQKAIELQQLYLVFQPQFSIDNIVIGAEILVRWKHPDKGLIPTYTFIKVAEDSGLILELGNWIFEYSCRTISKWKSHDTLSKLKFSINISAKQLQQEDFYDYVKSTLYKYSIDPKIICFELTETQLLNNLEFNISKIDKLQKLGITFSVDDFGTGYSSLNYLKRLPVNQLKIDKSFVDDLSDDKASVFIAKAIIALGSGLELMVIAEGVENEKQHEILNSLGCRYFQGYFYSKPVLASEYEKLFN